MPIKAILFSILLILLSSCGIVLQEAPINTKPVEIQSSKCLNQAVEDFKLFFLGTAQKQNIEQAVVCISQVLIAFKDNIKGDEDGIYLPNELSYFVEKNFLNPSQKITPEFLKQIMILKKTLVGGDQTKLTAQEVIRLSELILSLKKPVGDLNDEMLFLSSKKVFTNYSDEDKDLFFQTKKVEVNSSIQAIFGIFVQSGLSYEINDFMEFIKQAALFAQAKPETVTAIEKTKVFVINFKINLVGGGSAIQSKDWLVIAKTFHQIYFEYLRYDYFLVQDIAATTNRKWKVYSDIALEVTDYLELILSEQQKNGLTNQQIYDLVSSAYAIFTDEVITLDLVEDADILKQFILGQKQTQAGVWKSGDIALFQNKIPMFTKNTGLILSYIDLIESNIATNTAMSKTDFRAIEKDFRLAVITLSDLIDGEITKSQILKILNDLNANQLIDELRLTAKTNEVVNLIFSLKGTLSNQQSDLIRKDDVKKLLLFGSQILLKKYEYELFVKPHSVFTKEFNLNLKDLITMSKPILLEIIKQKNSKKLTHVEVADLLYHAQFFADLPKVIAPKNIQAVVIMLMSHVFRSPEIRLNGGAVKTFIDQESAHYLFSELSRALDLQLKSFDVFKDVIQLEYTQFKEIIKKSTLDMDIDSVESDMFGEIRRLHKTKYPLNFNSKGQLDFSLYPISFITHTDFYKSLLSQNMSRFLIRSFSTELVNVQTLFGLTEPELQTPYNIIKPILVSLEFTEEKNITFISSRFREANLFVLHANGDLYINFEEIHDIILHVASGLSRSADIKPVVIEKCLPPLNDLTNNQTTVSEDCLLEAYWESAAGFDQIPSYLRLKDQFTIVQNKAFYLGLLKTAGHILNDKKVVAFVDMDLYPHVVQYIESIYKKYDANLDGVLVKNEALIAFPVFKPTIKLVLKGITGGGVISEEKYPGVFMYLLKYKRPPKGLSETFKFLSFIDKPELWDAKTNRLDLSEILMFIAEVTTDNKAKEGELPEEPPAPEQPPVETTP